MVSACEQSEALAPSATPIDPEFITRLSRAHEKAGFDRVLVRTSSSSPDSFLLSAHVLASTDALGVLVAHRPSSSAPTVIARAVATLDQLHGGRVALHIVAGGDATDLARDGDYCAHDERYERAAEFVTVLKRTWTEQAPVSFAGRFYKFDSYRPAFPCLSRPHVRIYAGGASDAALAFAARHADTLASWGEPLDDVAEQVTRSDAIAGQHGRILRHSLSVRPILGRTDDEAWQKAHRILDAARARNLTRPAEQIENTGSKRLLAAAHRGTVLDRCLFTPLVEATGARGNATALVGTAHTVAEAILDYQDVGIDTFIIAGFATGGAEAEVTSYAELIARVRSGSRAARGDRGSPT